MSIFECVEKALPVEIFALNKAYLADNSDKKVNLGIGAYRTDKGKPWILPSVRKAELDIANDASLNHEYLGQLGYEECSKLASKLLFGDEVDKLKDKAVIWIQTLSGTGAIRLAADFLKQCANFNTVYISDPSWPNHKLVMKHANFGEIKTYRYWDADNRKLDFEGMKQDLENAPERSVIILHACAHNPTGVDPTDSQWEAIANIMKERKLFPFFDCAYQGFASGDLMLDSKSIRYFISHGFEMVVAQSFSKNFALYNERIGNLTLVINDVDKKVSENIKSQITLLVRGNYSNPPAHGARIVQKILSNQEFYDEWIKNIQTMASRIKEMRAKLQKILEDLKTPGDWSHITSQIGMFSYTGLNEKQVQYLVNECHIYLPKSGRISICGLNSSNIEYVAKSINAAVTSIN